MAKVLEIFVVALLITILHGFPQKPPERNQQRPQISNFPAQKNVQKQGPVPKTRDQIRRTRDVDQKPIDRSQISTLPAYLPSENSNQRNQDQSKPLDGSQTRPVPATINTEREDTSQNKNTNRYARETDEEPKHLDSAKISTPSTDIKFEETKAEHSSDETQNSRETREAENDDSSEESKEKIKPISGDIKIQPYRPNTEKQNSSEEDNREARSAEKKGKDKNKKI